MNYWETVKKKNGSLDGWNLQKYAYLFIKSDMRLVLILISTNFKIFFQMTGLLMYAK